MSTSASVSITCPTALYILTARDLAHDRHTTLVRYHVSLMGDDTDELLGRVDELVGKIWESVCTPARGGQLGTVARTLPPTAGWAITPGRELLRLNCDDGTGTHVLADAVTGLVTTLDVDRLSTLMCALKDNQRAPVFETRVQPALPHMTRSRHDTLWEANAAAAETPSHGKTLTFYGPLRLKRWVPKN